MWYVFLEVITVGRLGITQAEVSKAADRLLSEGVRPTVDNVRAELGDTGSRTTINKYLKVWRGGREQRDAIDRDLGDHLLHVLKEQSQTLVAALEATANAKYQAKTAQHETTIDELGKQIATSAAEITQLRTQLEAASTEAEQQHATARRLQAQLGDVLDELQTLRETYAKETARRETLEAALADRDRQIMALQKDMRTLQSRNDILGEAHARKSAELQALEQRDREQRALIKEKSTELKVLARSLKAAQRQQQRDIGRLANSVSRFVGSSALLKPTTKRSTARR